MMYYHTFRIRTLAVLLPCVFLFSACSPVTAFLTNSSFLRSENNNSPQYAAETPDDADLFTEDIRDPLKRIKRVENAVLDLQQQFDTLLPSMSKLTVLEQNIRKMTEQMGILLDGSSSSSAMNYTTRPVYSAPGTFSTSTASPVNLMPTGHMASKMPQQKQTKMIAGTVKVKKLRLGTHKSKTRIVLDVSGPTAYHYDLDNNEHLLVIELPDAGWSGQREWSSRKAPLISSYTVQPLSNNAGSRVIIQLKHDTSVVYETTIPADGFSDYRIVLDLSRS